MTAVTPRERLSALLTGSGLSVGRFARVLGVDERTLRRWLAADIAVPESRAAWLARVVRLDVTRDRVTVVLSR